MSSSPTPEPLVSWCAHDGDTALAYVAPEAWSRTESGGRVHLAVPGLTDAQCARAGAPTRREHLRGVVTDLFKGECLVTVHAVVADAHTDALELIDALSEIRRLRLRHPDAVDVVVSVSGEPTDPWVIAAGLDDLVVDDELGAATLVRLRDRWTAALAKLGPVQDRDAWRRGERLLRALDDLPRRLLFEMLKASWQRIDPGWPLGHLPKQQALPVGLAQLGEPERWMKAFKQYSYDNVRRMVLIPTWQCELRCSYCWIPKQEGRVMDSEVAERAIDMLMGTGQQEVMLQFFGGEALIEYERVKHAITYASERAEALGKQISFVVSSNGWSLDADKVAWLAQHPVKLELSLDGDRWTQERYRPSRWKGVSSYDHSIHAHADTILSSGIEQYVIMVVHPTNVGRLAENFFHIADLGFEHIQINNMLGRIWTDEQKKVWAEQLFAIGEELVKRWNRGERLEFIDIRHRPHAMRLNGEVTVDWDGTIFGGNGFLHETEHKDKFVVGHLDEATSIDRYWIDATDNNFLLDWSYRPKVTHNNFEVGKVMASFCQWLRKKGYTATGRAPVSERAAASA